VNLLISGPLIGGTFSEPAARFPRIFDRILLFKTYPYALPCIITGAYALLVFALNAVLLREPSRREQDEARDEDKNPSIWTLLTLPVRKALLVFSAAMLLGLAYSMHLLSSVPLLLSQMTHYQLQFCLCGSSRPLN
jgi:hypothetical protein